MTKFTHQMTEIFENLGNHPLNSIRNNWSKLNKSEVSIIFDTIQNFVKDKMDHNQRTFFINRMFVDDKNKPKHHTIICELLFMTSVRYYNNFEQ